jgi:hypothetical protein
LARQIAFEAMVDVNPDDPRPHLLLGQLGLALSDDALVQPVSNGGSDSTRLSVGCVGQRSVPEAIVAFLDSSDVEDAIRLAVSLGGDADTQAAIAGGIAEAFYGRLPEAIVGAVKERLPLPFIEVVDAFRQKYLLDTAP